MTTGTGLLEGLNPAQKEAVETVDGLLLCGVSFFASVLLSYRTAACRALSLEAADGFAYNC